MSFFANVTQVSKASRAIKRLIAATVGAWAGKKVSVEQARDNWTYQLFNDTGEPTIYIASATGGHAYQVPKPKYGGAATQINRPEHDKGDVVVIKQMGSVGSISIVIPRLDPGKLDVARDAMQSKNKKATSEILREFGLYAGIAQAIVEAQVKTLDLAEKGGRGIVAESRYKRDLDAFLARHKG